MRRFIIAVAALLASGTLAKADEVPATTEQLIVAPYPGETSWKTITDKRDAQQRLIEQIPANESESDIKNILTVQTFYRLKNEDPVAFLNGLLRRVGAACANTRVNGPNRQVENGYPVSYGQAYCINQRGASKDVDIFVKVIAGADGLYVVQREFRRPTKPGGFAGVTVFSKDEMDQLRAKVNAQGTAAAFLSGSVQLCPPATGGGACPSTTPEQPGAAPGTSDGAAEQPTAAQEPPAAPPEQAAASPEPATASPAPPPPAAETDTIPPFVNGTSTSDEVRKRLGAPVNENHNPDGRFVYVYQMNGVYLTFLFDSKHVLIRGRAYGRSAP